MVIEEAFAVLCWQSGQCQESVHDWTIETLAEKAKLPLEGVVKRLEKLAQLTNTIEIESSELSTWLEKSADRYFLLDVRNATEFSAFHLPGSHLMASTDLAKIFEGLKEFTVIILSEDGVRSFSAALYLREAGLPQVKSLRGGLDAWRAKHADRI